jgi:hypothetical protein
MHRRKECDHVKATKQKRIEYQREMERRQPTWCARGIGGIALIYSAARTGTFIIIPTTSEI